MTIRIWDMLIYSFWHFLEENFDDFPKFEVLHLYNVKSGKPAKN